jgi:hypothetical protein
MRLDSREKPPRWGLVGEELRGGGGGEVVGGRLVRQIREEEMVKLTGEVEGEEAGWVGRVGVFGASIVEEDGEELVVCCGVQGEERVCC